MVRSAVGMSLSQLATNVGTPLGSSSVAPSLGGGSSVVPPLGGPSSYTVTSPITGSPVGLDLSKTVPVKAPGEYAPGASTYGTGSYGGGYSSVGLGILLYLILVTFIWVLLYSFNPTFVQCYNDGEENCGANCSGSGNYNGCGPQRRADPARVFVWSLIIALIILVLIWLFRSCAC